MNLRDLVDTPQLGIPVLYADDAMLERRVGWTYTTDLPDPSRYLSAGLVVMTGLMWRREARRQRTLREAPSRCRGRGSDRRRGPPRLRARRSRRGLPWRRPSATARFQPTSRSSMSPSTSPAPTPKIVSPRLTSTLVRQRQLLAEVAEGQALDESSPQVAASSRMPCWVVTATGRQIVTASGELSERTRRRHHRVAMSARQPPAAAEVPDARGPIHYSVFGVGSSAEGRMTGWFLVVRGNWADWEPNVVDAMAELRAIAALDKSRSERRPAEHGRHHRRDDPPRHARK